MKTIALAALIGSVVLACPSAPPRGSFHERVMRASAAGESNFVLEAESSWPWNRAYFFGPYTTNSEIDTTIGFHCQDCQVVHLDARDDLHLLLLVANNKVIGMEELPRAEVEVDPAILKKPFRPRTRFSIRSQRPVVVGPSILERNVRLSS